MATPDAWLARLAHLKVYKDHRGTAPHKPLLLLVILELAEEGHSFDEPLALTPELAFRFSEFWSIVAHRRTQPPDVRYPFLHLSSDGVWSSLDEHGNPTSDRTSVRYAALPSDFVSFAVHDQYRARARQMLIAKYFQPNEQAALCALTGVAPAAGDQIEKDAAYKSPEEAAMEGRNVRFRLNIVAAYNYTCALTRYRLTTISGKAIVDAAHIHQYAKSHNNDISNGMALSKSAHWLFDEGLWSLTDDYRVIVADEHFAEHGPEHILLRQYRDQQLHLPSDPQLWPSVRHITWHRNKKFKGVAGS